MGKANVKESEKAYTMELAAPGIKKACADLKAAYPNLNWEEGKLLNSASKAELQKWVEGNR